MESTYISSPSLGRTKAMLPNFKQLPGAEYPGGSCLYFCYWFCFWCFFCCFFFQLINVFKRQNGRVGSRETCTKQEALWNKPSGHTYFCRCVLIRSFSDGEYDTGFGRKCLIPTSRCFRCSSAALLVQRIKYIGGFRIVESFRLEKTFRFIKCNHEPNLNSSILGPEQGCTLWGGVFTQYNH